MRFCNIWQHALPKFHLLLISLCMPFSVVPDVPQYSVSSQNNLLTLCSKTCCIINQTRTRLSQGTDSTVLRQKAVWDTARLTGVHTINFCFRQARSITQNTTIPVSSITTSKGFLSAASVWYLVRLPQNPSCSPVRIWDNKILLTLWAALHSTIYDKRSLTSKPLHSYTVTGCCSKYGNRPLLKHFYHTAFTSTSDSIC